MKYLVTGVAGFIGFHTALRLLEAGIAVVGIDNVNSYYDPSLKEARLSVLATFPAFQLIKADIADQSLIEVITRNHADISYVVHLAAQAGVRYSLVDPYAYTRSNIDGQVVMLELARRLPKLTHFVYASSSSVYGANPKLPFAVEDRVDNPVSLYAATKKSGELIAHSYSHIYGLPVTGLRFFTVYGPWGRPDMSPFLFTSAILENRPIRVFNHGKMKRDFTYIDDIVDGILAVALKPPSGITPPYRIYNLGNHQSVQLMHFIQVIEASLGKKAEMQFEEMQDGDVPETFADIGASTRDFGYIPKIGIDVGIPRFIQWYRDFYRV